MQVYFRHLIYTFFFIVCLFLTACTTAKFVPSDYTVVNLPPEDPFPLEPSLDDLRGHWEAIDGTWYEYPFISDGKTYLLFHIKATDDTELWFNYAGQHKMKISELWEKRYARAPEVYNSRVAFPVADGQGIQYGIRLESDNGRIYGNKEYLIPERILSVNLAFFKLSADKQRFIENGTFHLTSDFFTDLHTADDIIYEKK
jgi:hypothetical protein